MAGEAWPGGAGLGQAQQGRQDRQGRAGQGGAWHGWAQHGRHGRAWPGTARRGPARHSTAGPRVSPTHGSAESSHDVAWILMPTRR
jgi:hypothetical protein